MRPLLAEFIGTFVFVFLGTGAVSAAVQGGALPPMTLQIAFAHGIGLFAMITAIGHVSGGHINPAVTFAAILTKKIDAMLGVMYIVAQCAGAALGAMLIGLIFPAQVSTIHIGTPALAVGLLPGTGLLVEIVMTFFLVFGLFATLNNQDKAFSIMPGLVVGLIVFADIMVGGALTGAAMNPARAFGPALASGHWDMHWIYWVGPLVGGGLGGFVASTWMKK
jgi:MIP family channel proteins